MLWANLDESMDWSYNSWKEMDSQHVWDYPRYYGSRVAAIISRHLEYHTSGLCSCSSSTEGTHSPLTVRLATILWKTMLACRLTKHKFLSSLTDDEISDLVTRWWDMIPEAVKSDLKSCLEIMTHLQQGVKSQWSKLCAFLKQQGHSCYEGHPRESMWRTWVTVQDRRLPYLPGHPECLQCTHGSTSR
jgi:hypothetical protein